MGRSLNDRFTSVADRVSWGMGTPANIGFWLVAVTAWFVLFAFGILGANTKLLPGWFTSNAFNFPLNTVTTLAELYIGFLVGAAANRTERTNHAQTDRIEQLEIKLDTELGENTTLTREVHRLTTTVHALIEQVHAHIVGGASGDTTD